MRLAVLALLVAGCASTAKPEAPASVTTLECERARIVVPVGESTALGADGAFTRGTVTVRAVAPTFEAAGESFSVMAEGNVRILRWDGRRTFEEGPYRLVIYRDGKILTR